MNEMNGMWGQPTNMPQNRMRNAGMQGTQSFNTQQMLSPPYLPGRVINNPNEIRPNEVPMDGTPSVFLLNDASGVLVKWWNTDGQLCTQIFIPQMTELAGGASVGMPTDEFQKEVFDRFDKIEKKLNQRPYQKNTNYKKKEGKNDG